MSHDDLTPEERALLSNWRAPSPPPGFADAVLARAAAGDAAVSAQKKSRFLLRRAGTWLGAAAALLLAGVSALFFRAEESRGSLDVSSRTTVALGDRAVAVAEAGASLSWIVSPRGDAIVTQDRGDVFYRVDRGDSFVVSTPEGTVRVVGTCFRVEVESMQGTKAGLLGAAAGAAVTAAVLVTVYEGQVVTASELGSQPVSAGESVRLEKGAAPALAGRADSSDPPAKRKSPAVLAVEAQSPEQKAALAEAEKNAPLPLRLETARLRERVAELETQLADLEKKSRPRKTFDIPQEELELMASKCELRWDILPLGADPDTLDDGDAQQLGLSPEDRKKVDALIAEEHKEMRAQIEKIYTEATGDPNPAGISTEAMINEVQDKTPKNEMKLIFQKLARERAGQLAAPDQAAPQSAAERLMRLMTGAGDRFESKLGGVLGPDMAHAMREMNGGWGNRSVSSYGCPKN